ncbi:MAG: hypothetical protein LBV00_12810 [Propionibacteriaceae bacterium]|jgi:hypothetical protein|nr:hypothetical protein [Propionibacteriaceae bacterium]
MTAAILAIIMGGIGVWLLLTSHDRSWWMIGGAVALVLAFAGLTPVILGRLSPMLASRTVSARTLAGRILVENSRRWSAATAVLSVALGLVFTLFTMSASSIAGQVALEASPIPAGSARIETLNPTGDRIPKSTATQFETDLELRGAPLKLTELDAVLGEWGVLQSFDSLHDAKQLLGDLSNDAIDTLQCGGALVVGRLTDGHTHMNAWVANRQASVDIPILAIRTSVAHRFATGGGFVLAEALPDILKNTGSVRTWNVYQGLSVDQDIRARAWPAATGLSRFEVQAYRPIDGFSFPLWLAISLCGFGLFLTPLLALVLRHEVKSLGGIASSLRSIGLGRSWIRPVFSTLSGAIVMTAVFSGITPSVITVIILSALYPGVFNVATTPWWILGGFGLGLFGSTQLAIISANRQVGKQKHIATI